LKFETASRAYWIQSAFYSARETSAKRNEEISRMRHHLAHDGVHEAPVLILMASDASLAPDVITICAAGRCGLGLFLCGWGLSRIGCRLPRTDSCGYTERE
jgi:hypothetical protein